MYLLQPYVNHLLQQGDTLPYAASHMLLYASHKLQ